MSKKLKIILLSAAAVVIMVIATFADLPLSKAVADPDCGWAFFFEVTAEVPTVLLTAGMCLYLFLYSLTKSGKLRAVYCILCCIASVSAVVYSVTRTLKYLEVTPENAPGLYYGVSVGGIVVIFAALLISAYFIRRRILTHGLDEARIVHSLVSCVIAALLTLTLMNVFKIIWGRMRFREMLAAGDTAFAAFTPWFKPNGVTGYRSFPSGHTANCVLLLYATYFNRLLPDGSVFRRLNYAVPIILSVVVAISRVMIGAHFFSDVVMGAVITALIVYVTGMKRHEYEPLK